MSEGPGRDTVWLSPDRFCELAALFKAHISRRSTDQPGDRMSVVVLRHVDVNPERI